LILGKVVRVFLRNRPHPYQHWEYLYPCRLAIQKANQEFVQNFTSQSIDSVLERTTNKSNGLSLISVGPWLPAARRLYNCSGLLTAVNMFSHIIIVISCPTAVGCQLKLQCYLIWLWCICRYHTALFGGSVQGYLQIQP